MRLPLLTMTCLLAPLGLVRAADEVPRTIERKDPRFDRLVPKDAVIETLADGYHWTEGPVWDRSQKAVLFSDIPANVVLRWKEGGVPEVFLKPSGYLGTKPFEGREPGSNGLTFDSQSRLVLCQHGERRVARLGKDGTFTVLADRYQGKRFNSPNDLVFHSSGDLYFTDPPYGLPKTFDDPARELPWCGVYRLKASGEVVLLTKELKAPNGIALSPDERRLYVTSSHPEELLVMVYDLAADGSLGAGKVFADMKPWKEEGPGSADGIKVDAAGNVFSTGPGGIHVFAPDGTLLGSFLTGVPTANLNWGDDGKTLYITATTALCRVKLTTRGKGF
jgi:gluconolactonase